MTAFLMFTIGMLVFLLFSIRKDVSFLIEHGAMSRIMVWIAAVSVAAGLAFAILYYAIKEA